MDIIDMNSEIQDLILIDYYQSFRKDRFKKEYIALSNLSVYYIQKYIKRSNKNNKLKISALMRNGQFELPDRSYSGSLFWVYHQKP